MSQIAKIIAAGATLMLALILSVGDTPARVHFQAEAIQKDLATLVDLLENGKGNPKKIQALVAVFKGGNNLEEIMGAVYKPSNKMGIGFNPAKKSPGDGIEKRINDLATKKGLAGQQLLAERHLLKRMVAYNRAMFEITKAYVPLRVKNGKGPADWNNYNLQMKQGSEAVLGAIKANDPKALKKAMGKIASACNDCHTDFR